MLGLSIALALSPSLCWNHCLHCAGITALVVLVSFPLLRWCCCCLRCGLPHCLWLCTCQLNKGKNTCKSTAQCKHNKGKEGCMTRALMPVQQQRSGANMPAQWGQQCWCNDGEKAHATWGQRGQRDKKNNAGTTRAQCSCNVGDGASTTRAITPLWQQQRHLRIDDGNNAIVTMATTPAWQRQQHHRNEGNNIIATTAKMPGLQRHLRIDMAIQLWWGQQSQLNDSKDTCASMMMATTSFLWGQQCQLYEYANLTMAETPSWQEQHLQL